MTYEEMLGRVLMHESSMNTAVGPHGSREPVMKLNLGEARRTPHSVSCFHHSVSWCVPSGCNLSSLPKSI